MENIYYECPDDKGIKADAVYLKHKELLNQMAEAGTVGLYRDEDGSYSLVECCDGWYSFKLTKDNCMELSQMFREIADKTINKTKKLNKGENYGQF